jgi:HSP20 family protein
MSNETIPVNTGHEQNGQPTVHDTQRITKAEPSVDILETADHFALVVDLPGVEREDIALQLKDDGLWLEAVARMEKQHAAIQRPYSQLRYSRAFALGKKVDRERIQAELKHGVLRITLPKAEAAQPRSIEVHAA